MISKLKDRIGIIAAAGITWAVNSLASNILMAPSSSVLRRMGFFDLCIKLSHVVYPGVYAAKMATAFAYNPLIHRAADCVMVVVAILLLLRRMNRLYRQAQPAQTIQESLSYATAIPSAVVSCPYCTSEFKAMRETA